MTLARRHPGGRSPTRHRRGAAALEFALCLPFYLLMGMGIIDYSTAIVHKQNLLNAAREGALAGTQQTTSAKVVSTSNARMSEFLALSRTCSFGTCAPQTEVILVGGSPSARVVRAVARLRNFRGITRLVPVPREITAEYTVLWEKQP